MAFTLDIGKNIPDKDFDDIDYSKVYIGDEYNIKKYRIIQTIVRNYDAEITRKARRAAKEWFRRCYNVDTLHTEEDIYRYLSNPDSILIGIMEYGVYYIYCLSRYKMSQRAMNNKNFRYNYMGQDYVKFLPKTWTSEEGFQALLNSNYSIYLFNMEGSFDSMIGYIEEEDEGESFRLAQRENYGKYAKFDKAWDLLYLKNVLMD